MTRRAIASLALCATLLAGCSTAGEHYPSLAVRDVERAQGQFEPIANETLDVPKVDVDLTGGLPARLATLTTQAEREHGQFLSAAPGVARTVDAAEGSAVGSDRWAAAQVALADLDSTRSLVTVALADLDSLYVAASVEANNRISIIAARKKVSALVADEDATLARLRARVR